MGQVIDTLQATGAFLVGLALRVGVVALVVAALLLPVGLVLGAVRLARIVLPALRGLRRVGRVLYKPGLRYAAGHTWLERDQGRVRVGLDGVAQEILPWALGVELPRLGARVGEGEVVAVVSCGGVEARIAAPIAGTVVAVNAEVERDPSLVKVDGYGRGWLFVVEPADARWSTLPSGDAARAWMAAEAERLDRFLEDRLGLEGLAARSGPAPMVSDATDWRDLTRDFLRV
jgi:glycine cleavage system H lipoate-binding protein